mmetsp:Transcript_11136/g.24823  ORF Transcript_11136/g.24823 Transcript_11136/m.24823 type:complete len:120 (+) Transcript_11136:719-1078(+)
MVESPCLLNTIDWLLGHGIWDTQDLTTAGSLQFKAGQWIADQDELQEEIPVAIYNTHPHYNCIAMSGKPVSYRVTIVFGVGVVPKLAKRSDSWEACTECCFNREPLFLLQYLLARVQNK